jgi:hypothetical protein
MLADFMWLLLVPTCARLSDHSHERLLLLYISLAKKNRHRLHSESNLQPDVLSTDMFDFKQYFVAMQP